MGQPNPRGLIEKIATLNKEIERLRIENEELRGIKKPKEVKAANPIDEL